ncbi:MAG: HEAT repeat domain-containing protein, partial [Planctomycetes bacterium]|nr:HEAT repeat domain-containing protein [Planctomycetota bacterium]
SDGAVRYWAAMGLLMRRRNGVELARADLHHALTDKSPSVRIAAAEALGRYGEEADLNDALPVLLELAAYEQNGLWHSVQSLNAIDALDSKATSGIETVKTAFRGGEAIPERMREYIPRLIERIVANAK